MSAEQDMWADVVLALVAELARLWDAVPTDGWSREAAFVGWSCRETA